SRQFLNRAPSSSGSVDIATGIVKYVKTISYTRFARLSTAMMSAIASATPAMSAGRYRKVFGLTMPLHFHDVGQIPNNAALYPPRICPTDREVTSIFDAEYPFSHSPTQALKIAFESLVVLST